MDVTRAYCPTCEHAIRITVTKESGYHGGHASLPDDQQVVCLDFTERCSGEDCPLLNLPLVVLGVRLARSGMKPDPWKTVNGVCAGCGELTEMDVLNQTYAYCTNCGTTNRWTLLRLDDESRVAVMEREWLEKGGPTY